MKGKRLIITAAAICLLIAITVFSVGAANNNSDNGKGKFVQGGRNVLAYSYAKPGNLEVPDNAKFIGDFSGNWYQMGVKVGQGSGDIYRQSCDIFCDKIMGLHPDLNKTRQAIPLYEAQIAALNPGMLEFMHGIADGAAPYLENSKYAGTLSDYEIVFLPSMIEWMMRPDALPIACGGFAARGEATKDGQTYLVHNHHGSIAEQCYTQIFTVQPPKGNRVWVLGLDPYVTGNQVVNDKGVSISLLAGGKLPNNQDPAGYAFGVPGHFILLYAGVYANTAEEAIEIITKGTEAYRQATGRDTLLGCGGTNFIVADKDTMAVIEKLPDKYMVRYAGEYTGEDWTDPNYIVVTNHFICTDSYDEHNVFHPGVPMTAPTTNVNPNSVERFWTFMWDIEKHLGQIDKYMAMYIAEAEYKYDQATGTKVEAGMKDGVPQPWYKVSTTNDPPTNNANCKVNLLNGDRTEVYWTNGPACDWVGEWDAYYFK